MYPFASAFVGGRTPLPKEAASEHAVFVPWSRLPRRAVHFDADHLEGAVRSRETLRREAVKRTKRVGDLFEPVLTLQQMLPSPFTEALAAGPPTDCGRSLMRRVAPSLFKMLSS